MTPQSVTTEHIEQTSGGSAATNATFAATSPQPVVDSSWHGPIFGLEDEDANDMIVKGPSTFRRRARSSTPPGTKSKSYKSGGTELRSKTGKPALLLDIGSVGNLSGDQFAREQTKEVILAKRQNQIEQTRRSRPLNVSGVGTGSQACTHNVQLPVAVQLDNGAGFLEGTYTAPIVPNSSLPALLGLEACHRERAIIDCLNNKLYLAGDGDFDLLKALPPGTKVISLELAPSGHMMIPCADFAGLDKFQNRGGLSITREVHLPVKVTKDKTYSPILQDSDEDLTSKQLYKKYKGPPPGIPRNPADPRMRHPNSYTGTGPREPGEETQSDDLSPSSSTSKEQNPNVGRETASASNWRQ